MGQGRGGGLWCSYPLGFLPSGWPSCDRRGWRRLVWAWGMEIGGGIETSGWDSHVRRYIEAKQGRGGYGSVALSGHAIWQCGESGPAKGLMYVGWYLDTVRHKSGWMGVMVPGPGTRSPRCTVERVLMYRGTFAGRAGWEMEVVPHAASRAPWSSRLMEHADGAMSEVGNPGAGPSSLPTGCRYAHGSCPTPLSPRDITLARATSRGFPEQLQRPPDTKHAQ